MSKTQVTNVHQIDVNLDDILGTGVDSIMTSGEGVPEKKPGIFAPMSTDTTFLDKPLEKSGTEEEKPVEEKPVETPEAPVEAPVVEASTKDSVEDSVEDLEDPLLQPGEVTPNGDDDKNKGGRPTALVSATKKLIEKGLLTPFVNEKGEEEPIDSYTTEDFEELISANLENKYDKTGKEVAQQFFESLPDEMQHAYQYIANGGEDIKGMFQALAATQEVKQLDITKEAGQKYAIRAYLQATNYGSTEEIEDEIYSLEDRGDLEKKAQQFKPKLDAMQEQIVNQKVLKQQEDAKQRADQSQKYIETVYSTLETGELNGLKLDNKTQNMLYAGLVQSNYPSMSGKQTNMLGHLLEKYQWQEPRHDLIAEALWLLADPDGYKNNVSSKAGQEVTKKTLRTLKTEQATKTAGSVQEEESGENRQVRRAGVQRRSKNFFGR
jgi:hypothetical protein